MYGPDLPDYIKLACDYLVDRGCTELTVVGLCSSAFSPLQRGPYEGVQTMIAITPQLYRLGTMPGVEREGTNYAKYRLAKINRRFGRRANVKRSKSCLASAAERLGCWVPLLV